MLDTEEILGRTRPRDPHAVFRSVCSGSGRHEPLDVFERQSERPHGRSVRPRVVHVPEPVPARSGPERLELDRTLEPEGVGRHPAVDTAWVMEGVADQCRQSVGGTGPGVHGGDGTPGFRVVVRHDCCR